MRDPTKEFEQGDEKIVTAAAATDIDRRYRAQDEQDEQAAGESMWTSSRSLPWSARVDLCPTRCPHAPTRVRPRDHPRSHAVTLFH